jgi:guanine deaminase
MSNNHNDFMQKAIELSIDGMQRNDGGPFGAIIVKDGVIVGRGNNKVTSSNDPTAHAEITAIRDACLNLNTFQLDGCIIYTSCEPCPMCLGAIYWARPDKVYFACTKKDAADAGFDDDFIYKEIDKPFDDRTIVFEQLLRSEAQKAFEQWKKKEDKTAY